MALAAIVGFWTLAMLLIFEFPYSSLGTLGLRFRVKLASVAVILTFVGTRTFHRMGVAGGLFWMSTAAHLGIGALIWLQFSSLEWASVSAHAKAKAFSLVAFPAVVVGARVVIDDWGVEKAFRRILMVLMASAVVVLALPVWVLVGLPAPPGVYFHSDRYFGAFTNPTISAFAGSATACLGIALLGRRRSGLTAVSALSLGFASMFAGFSRVAAVGFAALLAFFALRGPGLRRFLLLAWMSVVAIIGLSTMASWAQALHIQQVLRMVQIGDLLTGSSFDVALGQRGSIWPLALREYLESPVVGQGLGAMLHIEDAPLVSSYFGEQRGIETRFRAGAHNHFLAMGGEAGVIPMMLFLLALFALARAAWTLPRSYPVDAAVGMTALIAVFGVSESNIDTMSPVLFVAGVACAFVADASDKRRPGGRPDPHAGERRPATARRATPRSAES